MIFIDVQLVNSGKHSEQKLVENLYLMKYWENLRNIFCTFLPNKFDFNGISKVNIYLGEFSGEDFTPASSNGIAIFRRNDFAFNEFQKLSVPEKNKRSLFYIEDSLLTLCKRFNLSREVSETIKSISTQVAEHNFELKLTFKKTTKWNKSRSLRAITELHHKVGGIDVVFSLVNKQGETLASHHLMTDAFWESVWFEFFKGGWRGENFVIENRVGKPVYTFNSLGEVMSTASEAKAS